LSISALPLSRPPGDPAEYAANDPNIIERGAFPTAKVVGDYDFVGDQWDGDLVEIESPDPDPLDGGQFISRPAERRHHAD